MSTLKVLIVDSLLRLPVWLAKPLGAIARFLLPGFRND